MYHAVAPLAKKLLSQGLEDDSWQWDWTTIGTLGGDREKNVTAQVIAKESGIWAADPIVAATQALSSELGMPIRIESSVKDGQLLKSGQVTTRWSGPAMMVLALERPFLNLASYVSGVSTATHALTSVIAQCTQGWKQVAPRVTSTRKTLPGYRDLAVHGVLAGGGFSHRVSLSGGVLIKENHIAAAGGIAPAVRGARSAAPHGLKIEIEVTSLDELQQAIAAGADGVLLDNFTPEQVTQALSQIQAAGSPLFVEVSGGITLQNLPRYVQPGVQVISAGSLTHTVKALDLSLLIHGLS